MTENPNAEPDVDIEIDPELKASEEVDIEPFEGDPEFTDAPWKQTDQPGGQDDGELPPYAGGSDA
jgi:hypothetical protein